MKLNVYKLGKMLKRLNCVTAVHYSSHVCIVSYRRYTKVDDITTGIVLFPLYNCMTIHDNGDIDYSDDVRPTHPLRHLLDAVYRSHQHKSSLTFGQAIEYMKNGYKISRKNWGGYWYLARYFFSPKSDSLNWEIVAHCKDGSYAPAQAYQRDMLADDWEVVGKENEDEEN